MNTVQCQVVCVTIDPLEGPVVRLTVPAYTVPPATLAERIEGLSMEYMALSRAQGESVSLGDFGMFVLAKASEDPREQTRD